MTAVLTTVLSTASELVREAEVPPEPIEAVELAATAIVLAADLIGLVDDIRAQRIAYCARYSLEERLAHVRARYVRSSFVPPRDPPDDPPPTDPPPPPPEEPPAPADHSSSAGAGIPAAANPPPDDDPSPSPPPQDRGGS